MAATGIRDDGDDRKGNLAEMVADKSKCIDMVQWRQWKWRYGK